jgi:hypothetical protein
MRNPAALPLIPCSGLPERDFQSLNQWVMGHFGSLFNLDSFWTGYYQTKYRSEIN